MDGGFLVPVAFMLMIVAIVVGPAWLRSRDKREMQETLRVAIEKGQALPPEVIDALSADKEKRQPSATRDLRTGVVCIAVAVGMALLAYTFSFIAEEAMWSILGAAAIPGMIGVAFVVLSLVSKDRT